MKIIQCDINTCQYQRREKSPQSNDKTFHKVYIVDNYYDLCDDCFNSLKGFIKERMNHNPDNNQFKDSIQITPGIELPPNVQPQPVPQPQPQPWRPQPNWPGWPAAGSYTLKEMEEMLNQIENDLEGQHHDQ